MQITTHAHLSDQGFSSPPRTLKHHQEDKKHANAPTRSPACCSLQESHNNPAWRPHRSATPNSSAAVTARCAAQSHPPGETHARTHARTHRRARTPRLPLGWHFIIRMTASQFCSLHHRQYRCIWICSCAAITASLFAWLTGDFYIKKNKYLF